MGLVTNPTEILVCPVRAAPPLALGDIVIARE